MNEDHIWTVVDKRSRRWWPWYRASRIHSLWAAQGGAQDMARILGGRWRAEAWHINGLVQ